MLVEKVKKYCKKHKTEIIVIGGVSFVAAVTLVGIKLHNEKMAEQVVKEVADISVSHDFSSTLPFEVRSHIRKLPDGMHASPTKELTALEHGYRLNPGETWVEAYVKMDRAA